MNAFTRKKLIVPAPHQRIDRGVPLRALYLLDCSEKVGKGNSVEAERLGNGEGIIKVIAATFNSRVKTPERLGRQLRFAGQILSKIPILQLSYPRRFDSLRSVYELVLPGHWQ